MGRSYSHAQDVLHLAGCTAGIYLCFLSFGWVQEKLYKTRHGADGALFTYTVFLVFCQCVCNTVTALVCRVVLGGASPVEGRSRVPAKQYAMVAAAYIGAMLCSNQALRYVNYPTQVLGKSCKMIPVMLMGICINGKRYKKQEYVQVALITLGISVFMGFQQSSGSKHESVQRLEGVALLLLSLALDGFTGPLQERIIARHRPSMHEMMFGTNAYAIPICLAVMFAQGSFWEAVSFTQRHPDILRDILEFCIFSAVGQNFIFLTMFRFDSLVLTTVTTTRKFFTILFSVLWFGNRVNTPQWVGVALVFAGLGLNIYTKYQAKRMAQVAAAEKKSE
ncbi:unnamed protein product (mitochondrion) [Plasmodiophora brassicae]|uniref:Sugar phosphate transporter domain-containing protein n=1 Tax=Plasmodiophora brassicae TaxID=37360 RepID=A0A3P3YKQ7_PLABS|nr:unnamed protein product [Plasmodiophora brassicae]